MHSIQKQPGRQEGPCGAVGWMVHVEAEENPQQLGAWSLKGGGGVKHRGTFTRKLSLPPSSWALVITVSVTN